MKIKRLVELPVVWLAETRTDEDERLDFKNEYGYAVFDLQEIIQFNELGNSTLITLSGGSCYTIDLPYSDFKNLYYSITRNRIVSLSEWLGDVKKTG